MIAGGLVLVCALSVGVVGFAGRQFVTLVQSTTPSASPTPPAPATPSVPANPGQAFVQQLQAQAEALIRGDEQGWLALVDPANKSLYDSYRSQFRTLRALRVSSWQVRLPVAPYLRPGQERQVPVTVAYCFAEPKCPELSPVEPRAGQLDQELTVRLDEDGQKVLIVGASPSKQDRYGPRPLPWESAGLTIKEGKRVIVAAPAGESKRLGEVVTAADRAAGVVDRYSRLAGREPPGRYVTFMAGPREWRTWRGGEKTEGIRGYAYPLGTMTSNVVLRMDAIDRADLDVVLRHEFGHVITATGSDYGPSPFDEWLIEGIAEYIARAGEPLSASPRLGSVQRYLRSGDWPGTINLRHLPEDASLSRVNAFYGLSHFAMSCIADRHGEAKLFAWWLDVVHGETAREDATPKHLGESWEALDRACVAFIRRVAG